MEGKDTKPGGSIRISKLAMKAVRRLRSLAAEGKAPFSLYIEQEGTRHRMTVIEEGRAPDSSYYIYQCRPGACVPQRLPAASTYVVTTDAEMDRTIMLFADMPELWSQAEGDAMSSPYQSLDEERFGE